MWTRQRDKFLLVWATYVNATLVDYRNKIQKGRGKYSFDEVFIKINYDGAVLTL